MLLANKMVDMVMYGTFTSIWLPGIFKYGASALFRVDNNEVWLYRKDNYAKPDFLFAHIRQSSSFAELEFFF